MGPWWEESSSVDGERQVTRQTTSWMSRNLFSPCPALCRMGGTLEPALYSRGSRSRKTSFCILTLGLCLSLSAPSSLHKHERLDQVDHCHLLLPIVAGPTFHWDRAHVSLLFAWYPQYIGDMQLYYTMTFLLLCSRVLVVVRVVSRRSRHSRRPSIGPGWVGGWLPLSA